MQFVSLFLAFHYRRAVTGFRLVILFFEWVENEVKKRRLKRIGLGILVGTLFGMRGLQSAEAVNNEWWTDTPETLVTGQIKTTDIEDNETIGTLGYETTGMINTPSPPIIKLFRFITKNKIYNDKKR